MALSILRGIGSRFLTCATNTSNLPHWCNLPTYLPALNSAVSGVIQVTPVRWRTRVPPKKKIGQFPPDFCKVSMHYGRL